MNAKLREKKNGDRRELLRRTALRAAAGCAPDLPSRPPDFPFDISVYQQSRDYGGMKWFY